MKKSFRVAILDLYEGRPNQGMRCIRQLLDQHGQTTGDLLDVQVFDVRLKTEVPGTDFDWYISTGGPGSPLESEGSAWETAYFRWLSEMEPLKKFIYFICHSFELVCRHYGLAQVLPRRSTAFGVFPVHRIESGSNEPLFQGLPDPFYAVDSRDFQVIRPDREALKRLGATLLCLEKERPHVPLERALMGIRFNPYWIGTQFHPEADAAGMRQYLLMEDKKQAVIAEHGEAKWRNMIEQLEDPDKIMCTYRHILPNFFRQASKNALD